MPKIFGVMYMFSCVVKEILSMFITLDLLVSHIILLGRYVSNNTWERFQKSFFQNVQNGTGSKYEDCCGNCKKTLVLKI